MTCPNHCGQGARSELLSCAVRMHWAQGRVYKTREGADVLALRMKHTIKRSKKSRASGNVPTAVSTNIYYWARVLVLENQN